MIKFYCSGQEKINEYATKAYCASQFTDLSHPENCVFQIQILGLNVGDY